MKKIVLLFFVVALCLVGCTTRITQDDVITPAASKLERGQKVYITLPQDGSYGGKTYAGSGTQVAHFLGKGIRPYVAETLVATAYVPVEEALTSAQKAGARYVFIPTITNWEPRAAAWSGRPTRVSISIAVQDLAADKQVLIRKIDITGRSATFVNQSPDDLVARAITTFSNEIF